MLTRMSLKAQLNALRNYYEWLLGRTMPRSLPVSLDIVLTRACNLNCTFCISYGSMGGRQALPFEVYQEIASVLFPAASLVAFCSGGEPLLYPRLRDALRLARDHQLWVRILSNGMLLSRETSQWLIDDQSVDELGISFDGVRPETFERIRRGARFGTVLKNIEYLARLKEERRQRTPILAFYYTVMRSNAEELPDLFGLCNSHGVEKVVVQYLNCSNDIDFMESLYNHRPVAEDLLARVRHKARESGIDLSMAPIWYKRRSRKRCHWPWMFCQIDTDSSIRVCRKFWRQRIGFWDSGFQTVWQGQHYQRIRESVNSEEPYFPYCRHCYVQTGLDSPAAHDMRLQADCYTIPGLEELQVEFQKRGQA